MLNLGLAFLTIIKLSALEALGLVCLILVCFALPVELIIDAYKKPGKRLKKGEKRELAINKISHWDYLIIILPIWLLLIIIFSNNYSDRTFSMVILGIGYSGLTLSPYNRRIDIRKINLCVFSISIALAIAAIIIIYFAKSTLSNVAELNLLYAPLVAYCYLIISRLIVKKLTGTYPITLDRYYSVGSFNVRYDRKANYWDLTWSFINMFIWIGLIIFCLKII